MSSREGSTHNSGYGAPGAGFILSWTGESALCVGSPTTQTLQTGSRSSSGSDATHTETSRQQPWRSQPAQDLLRSPPARAGRHCKLCSHVTQQRRAAQRSGLPRLTIDRHIKPSRFVDEARVIRTAGCRAAIP